jgi:hypothetical protein
MKCMNHHQHDISSTPRKLRYVDQSKLIFFFMQMSHIFDMVSILTIGSNMDASIQF